MVEKSKGKIITGSLSIAASTLFLISNLWAVINLGRYGGFNFLFFSRLLYLFGAIALTTLSIVGLIKFSDRRNRQVGMSAVIIFTATQFFLLLNAIISSIGTGGIYIGWTNIMFIVFAIGLLVAYFVCFAMFPASKPAQQPAGNNGYYAPPAAQQYTAPSAQPVGKPVSENDNADELNK